jgi:transcriptional regulator with XRE-family HTH domain
VANGGWQDGWNEQMQAWGSYVRTQRQMANLSLRQLAELAQISNPYLSQLERGMHEPSVRVIRTIADALGIPADEMFERLGIVDEGATDEAPGDAEATELAIRRDPHLTDEQKQATLAVYRSFRAANAAAEPPQPRARRTRKPSPPQI